MQEFFFTRIFPLLFMLVGGTLAFFVGRDAVRGVTSAQWPTTSGTVIYSSVVRRGGNDNAEVVYKYSVDDENFENTRYAFGSSGRIPGLIVEQNPVGKEVTVFYLANNPQISVLQPGTDIMLWVISFVGLIFFSLGVGIAVMMHRYLKATAEVPQSAHVTKSSFNDPISS